VLVPKTISGWTASATHLPNILLDLWSDRRRSAGLLLRGLKPRGSLRAASLRTKDN
jgi:hypothetical protein